MDEVRRVGSAELNESIVLKLRQTFENFPKEMNDEVDKRSTEPPSRLNDGS